MSIINAGYRMTVVSWEGDADNYNTIIQDGMSKEDVSFYVDLLKLIDRKNNGKNDFGNMYEPSDEEFDRFGKALVPIFKKHGREYDEEDPHYTGGDFISDFTGYSDHYFTRVVDKITVEYVPIAIELKDVTKEFV